MIRILIVEDEPLIRNGIESIIMEDWKGRVRIAKAADGSEALETMAEFGPDLVLTDIYMPRLNGLELIELAKEQGFRGKFVILSGYDEFALVKKGLQLGVLDYLLKPVDREELTTLLSRIAGRPAGEPESAGLSKEMTEGVLYVEEHCHTAITLEEMAKAVHLHPNYASLRFRKETGMTFVQYVQECRIRKAKELIDREPQIPFNHVALLVGYDSPPHFYKLFKKWTGLTPGEYRESRGSRDTE